MAIPILQMRKQSLPSELNPIPAPWVLSEGAVPVSRGALQVFNAECFGSWAAAGEGGQRETLSLSWKVGSGPWVLPGLSGLSASSTPVQADPRCSGLAWNLHLESAVEK